MPVHYLLIMFELFAMVLAISLHDMAQAWMANRLGDPTARMVGRITMNPAAHFDMFGMVISPFLSLFIFSNLLPWGWGKPVPMTYRNFPKKNGEMLAVLTGPVTQFLAAGVALVVLVVLKHTVAGAAISIDSVVLLANGRAIEGLESQPGVFPVLLVLYVGIIMNLLLCVINLLPMPFLDGGKILVHFLPYNAVKTYEKYSMFLMIGFFLVGGILISIVFGPLLAIFTVLLQSL